MPRALPVSSTATPSNIGLPILECPAASEAINEGDVVAINFDTGVITDETTGQTFQAAPFPPFIQKIIRPAA